MLYKKNSSQHLDEKLFRDPTAEYRGAPFWAWNCKVTPELIDRQVDYLKKMGFGGYHIHSRTGMDVPYLSKEFMDLISFTVNKAKATDTLAWLYDEDRWPSGAAGGLVTKTPKYRQRFLEVTREDRTAGLKSREEAVELGESYLFHVYDVVQNESGELVSYKIIDPKDEAEGKKWFTYCSVPGKSGWYNNQTYIDTLSKAAVDKFIETTHERYKETVGGEFDKSVPAIFTDEPQFCSKGTFAFATSDQSVRLPWTPKLPETFKEHYGLSLDEHLPELFWELPEGRVSRIRYLYHDLVCELFTEAFADNCGDWCEKNGISMTGHMMAEDDLNCQTMCLGEAMRSYRKFQIPGIDMLCGGHSYATAKQCQSAVHQYGREGMVSELYGVTDWDFDFRGHKHHGDWQAALGVTVRVPHLAWMSMKGEAKRDYPASIFYQSPWYEEYPYVENHFARLNTALTRGKPIVDIAVIHPVESYWLHWGPTENTGKIRSQLQQNFQSTIDWLLFGGLDFDFISEGLLPEQYSGTEGAKLHIGKMNYKTVVVPGLETIRKTTLDALREFKAAGGTIIVMGSVPKYVDAVMSSEPEEVLSDCVRIGFSRDELISALEDFREIEIRDGSGNLTNHYLYNYREDTDGRWLFIANGRTPDTRGNRSRYNDPERLRIRIKGEFTPVIWDTISGEIIPIRYTVKNGYTTIDHPFYAHDSLLLKLGEYNGVQPLGGDEKFDKVCEIRNRHNVGYELSEENTLLIDQAMWRVDSESLTEDAAEKPWHESDELLRVNNMAAKEAGLPAYNGAQPWVEPPEKLTHTVDLSYEFDSEIPCAVKLAIENAELCEVILNGEHGKHIDGYFVDESIGLFELPKAKPGKNLLLIRTPIGIRTKVEWCYLLGGFGVKVAGCEKTLTAAPEKLGFSTVTNQGFPFYTGNISYKSEFELDEAAYLKVRVSEYRGALVKVYLDGKDMGVIAYMPYRLDLGLVGAGSHTITYELFGTRFNAFGALHNTVKGDNWVGPGIWRTSGDKWCYEYNLRDEGILASPVIEVYKKA